MPDTYGSIAVTADDTALTKRVTACASQEQLGGRTLDPANPESWTYQHRWQWAAQPGWGAAMASATVSGNPNPGADPAVITDGMILSAVQGLLGG